MKEEERNDKDELKVIDSSAILHLQHREHDGGDQAEKALNGRQFSGRNQEQSSFVPLKGKEGEAKGDDIEQNRQVDNPEEGGVVSKPGEDEGGRQVAQESEHQGADLDPRLQVEAAEGVQLWKGIHYLVLDSLKDVLLI